MSKSIYEAVGAAGRQTAAETYVQATMAARRTGCSLHLSGVRVTANSRTVCANVCAESGNVHLSPRSLFPLTWGQAGTDHVAAAAETFRFNQNSR